MFINVSDGEKCYWQNLEINDAFLFLQLQSFTSFDGPISGDKSELLTTSSQALLHILLMPLMFS